MTDKQTIAEAERRFNNWWEAEGNRGLTNEVSEGFLKNLKEHCKEAWMNGALTNENITQVKATKFRPGTIIYDDVEHNEKAYNEDSEGEWNARNTQSTGK